MPKDPDQDEIAKRRDEVLRRMIAMPKRTHKDEPKRRLTPSPKVRQLAKRRTNKKSAKKS
jgi:hypothetical protein